MPIHKENSLSNPLLIKSMFFFANLIKSMFNPHLSYKKFRVIYKDQYIRSIDRFMVFVDSSYKGSHVFLLSTHNVMNRTFQIRIL